MSFCGGSQYFCVCIDIVRLRFIIHICTNTLHTPNSAVVKSLFFFKFLGNGGLEVSLILIHICPETSL